MSEQKQHQQQHHHHLQHLGTFLPMLCSKPSMLKNVHIPNPFNKDHSSSCRSLADDPSLSPKVGCMGQVKKKDNCKLGMVFPTTTNNSTNSHTTKNPDTEVGHGSNNNFSYSKLLRLFSSKTLLATPLPSTNKKLATTTTAIFCRKDHQQKICSVSGVSQSRVRSRSCEDNNSVIGFGSPINVADLDPPLPVVIKRPTSSASASASASSSLVDDQVLSEGDNNKINSCLWKRRSGGTALKGLEIVQQVHIPIQSATTNSSI